ncbi:MAG: SRPBCC family protein [Pseudolysinimonas sp.]
MWTTHHTAETDLPRETIWTALRELHEGRRNVPGADRFELDGPFAVGSVVHVTPAGQDTFESTIIELDEGLRYADRTEFGDVVLVFAHDLSDSDDGTRVTHTLTITGTGADSTGPVLGPQIAEDFPEAMQSLFAAARDLTEPAV